MWYRFAGAPILLSNPIVGGFWVNDDPIAYGQNKSVLEWRRLLKTRPDKINTQEKLNQFLSNANFVDIDGKKTYEWIDPKAIRIKNLFGEFYVESKKIELGEFMPLLDWARLLRTDKKNINTQDKFNSFVSSNIVNENGKATYKPKQNLKKLLSNPVVGGFYVDGDFYNEDFNESVIQWAKILKTSKYNVNSQEKLNDFLSKSVFRITEDNKKKYIPYISRHRGLLLFNNIEGGFFIGEKPIEYGQSYGVRVWSRLLNTAQENINTQKKLDDFLNDSIQIDSENNKIYKKRLISARERYFNDNILIDPSSNIKLYSQYVLKVPYDGKNRIIKFDFVFMKGEKILLALELNGGQHYGFISFATNETYENWQKTLQRDIFKINYCHNNKIPLLVFHHLLTNKDFMTITRNLSQNPNIYDRYVPQPVIDKELTNTSEEFIKRQIYSHLYPVFNNVISFNSDVSKKRYIKDTLILISKLAGIYESGIDKTDYINEFNRDTDLTDNYNKCLAIYKSLFPDYPIDNDNKITYNDLSKKIQINKRKQPEEKIIPSEE